MLFPPALSLRFDDQRFRRTFGKPNLAREPQCTLAGQKQVASVFHDAAREFDRILDTLHGCDASGAQPIPFHNGSVHFNLAVAIERRAGPRVEEWVVLEHNDGCLDGVESWAILLKNLPTGERGLFAPF